MRVWIVTCRLFATCLSLLTWMVHEARAQETVAPLDALRQLDTRVIAADPAAQKSAREAVRIDARNRLQAANLRETASWRKLQNRADWERYRDERLTRLRDSLGVSLAPLDQLTVHVTREFAGPGCTIRNVHFTSRSGFAVAANLYLPTTPVDAMPGILVCHSHHAPKHQGELQTMGVTWARSGAAVLVMDQFGHGERRLHKFDRSDSWPGSFRPERQDYYFRYNSAVLLQRAGQSLMGVMVADLMTGVDVLLQQPGIDSQRIMLLGAVAGGGDPAGVTAALDARITCAVPFNFGGYEPEDVFPLPENADDTFDFAGSGSWESTRNLPVSAGGGFMPWVIVGSIAPRHLIYAHEFRWDEPRDPVWKRLKQIYAWYQTDDRLSSVVGQGTVKGRPPEASHCTNIGVLHRSQIYPAFERWFGMPIPREPEFERFTSEQLRCFPDSWTRDDVVSRTLAVLQQRTTPVNSNESLQQRLTHWFGECEPMRDARAQTLDRTTQAGIEYERVRIDVPGQDVTIPLSLLVLRKPDAKPVQRVVVGLSQKGKRAFLEHRADVVLALVEHGATVVLADVRGTGESEPEGEGRGRSSGATSRAASELMLGRSTLGLRVSDVRTILAYLRQRPELQRHDFALWGEGFVPPNDALSELAAPLDAEKLPQVSEPLGALLATIVPLLEGDVRASYARGGARTTFNTPYVYVPYDTVLRGAESRGSYEALVSQAARVCRAKHVDLRDLSNRALSTTPDDAGDAPLEVARWLLARE